MCIHLRRACTTKCLCVRACVCVLSKHLFAIRQTTSTSLSTSSTRSSATKAKAASGGLAVSLSVPIPLTLPLPMHPLAPPPPPLLLNLFKVSSPKRATTCKNLPKLKCQREQWQPKSQKKFHMNKKLPNKSNKNIIIKECAKRACKVPERGRERKRQRTQIE